MKRNHVSRICWASLACVVLFSRGLSAAEFEWGKSTPAAEGISEAKLAQFKESLAGRGTSGLLVILHDKIVFEWYAPGAAADKPHGTASMAKAVVGGMSLAVAMQDGRIRPGDLAADYIPQWKPDPQKSKITVGQLATHSSGLDDAEVPGTAHEKLTGWKGD